MEHKSYDFHPRKLLQMSPEETQVHIILIGGPEHEEIIWFYSEMEISRPVVNANTFPSHELWT